MTVAQVPFEIGANTFGTLAPMVLDDGSLAEESDFPNNGLVWWMLQDRTRGFAQPGRIVTGVLERSLAGDSDDPGKQYYQVDLHSVHPARPDDLVEVLTADTALAVTPKDLVNRPAVIRLDHPSSGIVFVRVGDRLLGPFKAVTDPVPGTPHEYSISLTTMEVDHTVTDLSEERFRELAQDQLIRVSVDISLNTLPRERGNLTRPRADELLLGAGYTRLRSGSLPRVVLESDREVIVRAARRLLVRSRRQQLTALLTELADRLEGEPVTGSEGHDVRDVVQETLRAIQADESLAQQIAQALLSGEYVNPVLLDALRRGYVERETVRLRAAIAAQAKADRAALDELQAKRRTLEAELATGTPGARGTRCGATRDAR